jgi:hypothetical protein
MITSSNSSNLFLYFKSLFITDKKIAYFKRKNESVYDEQMRKLNFKNC